VTTRALLLAILLAGGAARAQDEGVDDLLWRARHLQQVRGDLRGAIALYEQALPRLDRAGQAEVRLRLAECHRERDPALALEELAQPFFARPEVPEDLRRMADTLRRAIAAERPPVAPEPIVDPARVARERARRVDEHLAQARALAKAGEVARAFFQVAQALALDPDHEEARRLEAELSRRLGGLTRFVKEQLELLRGWEDARVVLAARRVSDLLGEAMHHARSDRHNLADARFREALETIDASEFADESETLVTLRERVVELWTSARSRSGRPPPPVEPMPRTVGTRPRLRENLLDNLQEMLDRLSGPEGDERIFPVASPRGRAASRGWIAKPDGYQLGRDRASRIDPAAFARDWLRLRIEPASWDEPTHFLDVAGGMVLARNRPAILDAAAAQLEVLQSPAEPVLRARFVLLHVPGHARDRLGQIAGGWEGAGPDAVAHARLPGHLGLDAVLDLLRDDGVAVDPARDSFVVDLDNGRAQTMLVTAAAAPAQQNDAQRPWLLLDVLPLREADGRTAMALRLQGRDAGDGERPPTGWEASLFADLAPGGVLAAGPLSDPFGARGGETPDDLMVLWENPGLAGAVTPELAGQPDAGSPRRVEIPLDDLLLHDRVRDRPGPRRDPEQGFLPVGPLTVLEERAAFLSELLREDLATDELTIDLERAVLRVPPELRDPAAELVAALERESRRAYVVRVEVRAVRTPVFERWMEREGLAIRPFGDAWIAMSDEPQGVFLLRNLSPSEPADVFAPSDLPAITALGLQARHARSTRERTSPAWSDERELATGDTRVVTEGLRVTVRPFRWRGILYAQVGIETAALDSEVEEWALPGAVPIYRTRVSGTSASGMVDFGAVSHPRTALVCRIPHPTASQPGRLTEIAIALSIRAAP